MNGPVRYETLCARGNRMQVVAKEVAVRLHNSIRILLDSEVDFPEHVARYRAEVSALRADRTDKDGRLMQHVAHCTEGCVRARGGDLAFASVNQVGVNSRAPSHQKPPLPGATELAARLRDGTTTLEDLAAEYERSDKTLRLFLNHGGFNAGTGEPNHRPTGSLTLMLGRVDDQPWADDALCAQTDPEAFYPEKGGSTREAKAVCASCLVQAECLDYALDHDERFGIWGGLSERERRYIKKALNGSNDNTNPLTQQESA